MEGISLRRVLSMLIMMSIMLVQLAVAQEEDFVGFNNGDYLLHPWNVDIPSETPLFPGAPLPSDIIPPAPGLTPNLSPSDPATPSIPDSPSAPTTPLTPPSPTTPLPPNKPFPPATPLLPPETPLPPQGMTCEDKCAMKCSKLIISFLFKLCFKACKLSCNIVQSELIYNCTNNCAQSMPASLTYDEGQMDSYVNACYQKCKINHN